MSILGARVLRTEDPAFLTTGAVYTEDVQDERLTDAGYVHFVRSTIAHARIIGIDAGAAKEADGVIAVYTGEDLAAAGVKPIAAPVPTMNQRMPRYLLARDVVRFVGEAVAVVVTEEPYQGEDAMELVEVDYDPLPAVIDPVAASSGEGGLLFPEAGTNVIIRYGDESALQADLFDDCEIVVSKNIVNQRVAPAPMETRAAAAAWDDAGKLTAWIPSQEAHAARDMLADVLDLARDRVRIITPDVGGAFGAKYAVDPEHAVVCWVARQLGRPARWTETRNENMLAMTHGRAQRQTITIGGRRDGTVLSYRLEIVQDCGAYPTRGALLPSLTILMTPGTYAIPRAEAVATSVVTNTTPVAAYRGAGRPEATAAIERAIDVFAAEIGADPAAVRHKNLLPKFMEPHETAFGAVYDSGDYATALDKALATAGYQELRDEQARRRAAGEPVQLGIGMSTYVEITGGGPSGTSEEATVEVYPDGTATVLTGTSPHGQGHVTVWAMLASASLGIPIEKITVRWGDTELVPKGGGTRGSRSLQVGGSAVRKASQELLDLARERAAAELEADPADLVFDTGTSAFTVRGVSDVSVSLARLAESERLVVNTEFTSRGKTFPFGAHVAVVDVDTETGKVCLRRLVAVDDAGTLINPLIAEGQVHGGIAQGVAQAFLEEVGYDADGNPLTSTFADYPFISATELPSFELVEMETPTTCNPLGAKGIGEGGVVGSTPAVQNAVVDALSPLGVRHIDLPTSPLRVWRAIRMATSEPEDS
jgi:carbon-monoxide dehydrogenase large subunit